tara:strand:- start:92 stop:820 length:729 start_codon:yes stop_codon:yes gene_type:complete
MIARNVARVNILIYLVPQCSPFAKIAPKVITTRGKVCPPACPALLEEHNHTKENQTAFLATKEHFDLAVKSMLHNVCFVPLVLRKTWRHKVLAPSVVEVSISPIQVLQRVLFARVEPTWKKNTYVILQCANNVLRARSVEKVKHLAVHAFLVNFNPMLENVPTVIFFIFQKKDQAVANNVLLVTNPLFQPEVPRVSNVRLGNLTHEGLHVVHAQQVFPEKIRTHLQVASHVRQQRIKIPRSK